MRNFITKDPSVRDGIRQISKLKKDIRAAEKKNKIRITKLLAERVKTAVSSHKWRISPEFGLDSNYSRASSIPYQIHLSVVDPQKEAKNIAYAAKHSGSLMPKSPKIIHRLEVKTFNDLVYFGDMWEICEIRFEKSLIVFNYDSLRIISELGMDEVFNTIKKLNISLDLSHYIRDIENSERELTLKKSLVKDLSGSILFQV
jgi:hypothetical protein